MKEPDWERVEQKIRQFELIQRAGRVAEELIALIQESPYEDLNSEISKLIDCSLDDAMAIRHLSLDRITPFRIALISAELADLHLRYSNRE
ncbi:hypothetical protein AAHB34_18125 [Paenarthrobacter ureafaciens]|jgi:hypothetical protein